jgi:hypothetical protein
MTGKTTGAKVYYELLQKIDPDNMFTKRLKKLLYPSVMTKLYKKLYKNQSIFKALQDNEGSHHGKEF